MQLCYRGVPYEYNSTLVEASEGDVGGKYRGLPWIRTYVKMDKESRIQPTFELYYRGVSPKRMNISAPKEIPLAQPNSASSF